MMYIYRAGCCVFGCSLLERVRAGLDFLHAQAAALSLEKEHSFFIYSRVQTRGEF